MYIGWVIDRAQRALVSMQRINEILAVEPEIQDRALPPGQPAPNRRAHRFPPAQLLLRRGASPTPD